MAFELKNVVPWGRNLEEYTRIFKLTDSDYKSRIISFGDGPASFNFEMTKLDRKVVSLDPIYQFTRDELKQRIAETKDTILEQTKTNHNNFVWTNIKSIQDLEHIRMDAMNNFIDDFELGKTKERYIYHELPNSTKFSDLSFDLGLSSHFLILYSQLGLDFHIKSISEMLRICKEIRIFPILNLNAVKSEVLEGIIDYFKSDYQISIDLVDYEFQKRGNQMLKIKRK
ncbi:SAM-dependent methyltransferase [Flavobacterium commune]|uniref:SAM-dependent methyltransferase n=1 Tax=Flavobacterium commune TaxID=1306519 RepID=A0A1D9PCR8_9FLAO|nr:SAM-dependent methyltransferase [Flavobacterium commune]APA00352.1 SAM-dependent methyltransferase [Flavobacterium commune]